MYLVPNGTLPQSHSFASTNALGYYFHKKNCAPKIKNSAKNLQECGIFSTTLHYHCSVLISFSLKNLEVNSESCTFFRFHSTVYNSIVLSSLPNQNLYDF